MKTCVLIPSYNVGGDIEGIIKKIKTMALGCEIVVVDDGSTDNTEKAACAAGAIVVRHIKNLGKGASLAEGFSFILKTTDCDPIIVMDGDGQHNPEDIPKFISRAQDKTVDIIVGNRMAHPKEMPLVRRATNRFMSTLISWICRQEIPDTQCGFRLIRRKVLMNLTVDSKNYDFESEFLIKAARKPFKISSVPIEIIYKNETSYINPVKDTLRFIKLIMRTRSK